MTTGQGQDSRILRERAYADAAHLDVRYRTHQLYTVNPVSFGRWTRHRKMANSQAVVLDQGEWGALFGFDLSAGMISEAVQSAAGLPVHFFAGDAQAIPFSQSFFDVVMARHMLYHVPSIDRAVAEAARVLRPGGRFVATTNSAHTMPEYHALRKRASDRFPAMTEPGPSTHSFSLENGASFVQAQFDRVEVHALPGTLRFPTAQPFMDYFASCRALIMDPDHTDAEWQAILDFVRADVKAVIAREGRFDVTKLGGAIVAVKGG
jgi:SAM-dependent methyltransferase